MRRTICLRLSVLLLRCWTSDVQEKIWMKQRSLQA